MHLFVRDPPHIIHLLPAGHLPERLAIIGIQIAAKHIGAIWAFFQRGNDLSMAPLISDASGKAECIQTGSRPVRQRLQAWIVGDHFHPFGKWAEGITEVGCDGHHGIQMTADMPLVRRKSMINRNTDEGGDPSFFHDLLCCVLMAVKDDLLPCFFQLEAVGQQLGVMEMINIRV